MALRISARVARLVCDRLQTLTWQGAPLTVCVGDPPSGTPVPYAFIHAQPLPVGSLTVDDIPDVVDERLRIQVVEHTPVNVLALADEVCAVLEGFAPGVDGWRLAPLRVEEALPVQTANSGTSKTSGRAPSWTTLTVRVRGSRSQAIGEKE